MMSPYVCLQGCRSSPKVELYFTQYNTAPRLKSTAGNKPPKGLSYEHCSAQPAD